MKKDIHPNYGPAVVKCACGNVIETASTVAEMKVEICSACHPFYTGQKKIVDTAGRVDRFERRAQIGRDLQKVKVERAKNKSKRKKKTSVKITKEKVTGKKKASKKKAKSK